MGEDRRFLHRRSLSLPIKDEKRRAQGSVEDPREGLNPHRCGAAASSNKWYPTWRWKRRWIPSYSCCAPRRIPSYSLHVSARKNKVAILAAKNRNLRHLYLKSAVRFLCLEEIGFAYRPRQYRTTSSTIFKVAPETLPTEFSGKRFGSNDRI